MDVDLPLEAGEGHWTWFGGRPALDFLNTRRERWRKDIETLVVPSDVGAWLAEAGLVRERIEAGRRELTAARRLRDAIDEGVDALLERRSPARAAIAEIDSWLSQARTSPRLVLRSGRAQLSEDGLSTRQGLALVALDAARMLGTDERERVRVCASDTCGVRFYDHSRAARRKWCSMERCGNVAKARRHRDRA